MRRRDPSEAMTLERRVLEPDSVKKSVAWGDRIHSWNSRGRDKQVHGIIETLHVTPCLNVKSFSRQLWWLRVVTKGLNVTFSRHLLLV